MTLSGFLALMLGIAGASDSARRDAPQPAIGRLAVESQRIVRVPVRPRPVIQKFDWIESEGFKCVRTNAIRGALLSAPDHVDLLLPRRQRVRASFDGNCPALDFYGGFYLKTGDDRVCARRDSVHSRMGGSCRIERFRRLVPKIKN